MKSLFNTSLKKLLLLFKMQEQVVLKESTIRELIVSRYKSDIPYSKLCRLPTSEVKTMLKVPCPLSSQLTPQETAEHTAVFKRLRHQYNVQESSVCYKCQRKCPVRNIPFKQLEYKPQTNNKSAIHDFLLFALQLQKAPEREYSQLRWSAAYKTISSLEVLLRDFKVLGTQSLLYREVLKNLQAGEKKTKKVSQQTEAQSRLKQRRIRFPDNPYQT